MAALGQVAAFLAEELVEVLSLADHDVVALGRAHQDVRLGLAVELRPYDERVCPDVPEDDELARLGASQLRPAGGREYVECVA